MAKVKGVLIKYHEVVKFPWTIRKIKKAGMDPMGFLLTVGAELRECEDSKSEVGIELLRLLRDLELISKNI